MNIFNKIPLLKPKRNVFNLGFENRLTTDLFRLTPFFCKEALPDDVFKIRSELFARVLPSLNAPIMQRFNIRTYFFFVPTRIIWDDWEKWINPKSGVSDIVAPRIKFDNYKSLALGAPKTLGDYLGVNLGYSPEDFALISTGQGTSKVLFPDHDSEQTDTFGYGYVSALPFRAYKKIYNDWFIDLNNLEGEPELDTSSGIVDLHNEDAPAVWTDEQRAFHESMLKLRYRAWEHDYFTSAMPDPQRGPDVMAFDGGDIDGLSVSGEGNVVGTLPAFQVPSDGFFVIDTSSTPVQKFFAQPYALVNEFYSQLGYQDAETALAALVDGDSMKSFFKQGVLTPFGGNGADNSGSMSIPDTDFGQAHNQNFNYVLHGNNSDIVIYESRKVGNKLVITPAGDIAEKLSVSGTGNVAGVSVEELRVRMQMQSFLERNEIGGSRYTEMLYAHWGVKSADGRLQRSEYIGGWKQPLMINEVTQTSAPTDDDPLGQYAGQGTSSGMSKSIKYRVPEHGYILGIMCIMPRTGYFQGIEPMWNRFDRLDYFFPSFAHLGEQEVRNREIMFTGFDTEGTFGYQQRYAEYKASYDQVHGDMKGSLAFWHGARAFDTPEGPDDLPKLSIEFTTPSFSGQDGIDRIFPVASSEAVWKTADHFVVDIYNHCVASRRMPKFVTPRNGS